MVTERSHRVNKRPFKKCGGDGGMGRVFRWRDERERD